MLEDVLLIEDKHRRAAKQILDIIDFSDPHARLVIAIGGESGSGKSELAHMVARYLKKEKIFAKLIHTDDFYKISPKTRTEWRKIHDITEIGLSEYDWDKITMTVNDFKQKLVSKMPCIDLLTDQTDTLTSNFAEVSVLILEGLYSLHAKADEKIFIDLTYRETKKNQKLRGKEPENEFRMIILEREHQVIQGLRQNASLIVNKEYCIEKSNQI